MSSSNRLKIRGKLKQNILPNPKAISEEPENSKKIGRIKTITTNKNVKEKKEKSKADICVSNLNEIIPFIHQ